MSIQGPHPGIESLACLAAGGCPPDERARLLRHIASCERCTEVYSESLRWEGRELEEPSALPASGTDRLTAPPPAGERGRSRPAPVRWRPVPIAAIAAMGILAVGLWIFYAGRAPAPGADLQALVDAVGQRRFIEPRLSGGFLHGALPELRRGEPPLDPGDSANWKVFAVAEAIRQGAEDGVGSPAEARALAAAYLISGDTGASIRILGDALERFGRKAELLSDLSAALLVHSRREPRAGPLSRVRALDAARESVERDPDLLEGWFNLALAVEAQAAAAGGPEEKGAGRVRKAWLDYLERDPGSPWAQEARDHLERLPGAGPGGGEGTDGMLEAARVGDLPGLARLLGSSPRRAEPVAERELLCPWSEACLAGEGGEAARRREALAVLAGAVRDASSDPFEAEVAAALPAVAAGGARVAPRGCAAVAAYCEAARIYAQGDMAEASARLDSAASQLGLLGSPLELRARLRAAIALNYSGRRQESEAALDRLLDDPRLDGYPLLEGQARWMRGLIHAQRARFGLALGEELRSLELFGRAGDLGSSASVRFLLAESSELMGDEAGGWRHREAALALAHHAPLLQRSSILLDAVYSAVDLHLPWAAQVYADEMLAREEELPPEAALQLHLVRAEALSDTGLDGRALADLQAASALARQVQGEEIGIRYQNEIDAASARIRREDDPEEALSLLQAALRFFQGEEGQEAMEARIPRLHLDLGLTLELLGRPEEASREYEAGILLLEESRRLLAGDPGRAYLAARAMSLFESMIGLQLRLGKPESALAYAERGLALQRTVSGEEGVPPAASTLEPALLAGQLPEGMAVVYLVSLEDQLHAWVLGGGSTFHAGRPVARGRLRRMAEDLVEALSRRHEDEARALSGELYALLLEPLEEHLAAVDELVMVPGGFLRGLPFAVLRSPGGRGYAVERWAISVAPSAAEALAAGEAGSRSRKGGVLVVGNPRIDSKAFPGLAPLPAAEREARSVAEVHPGATLLLGEEATASRFVRSARGAALIHFAGHAVADALHPERSALLLAPDPPGNPTGLLLAGEISRVVLEGSPLVILGGCRTAAAGFPRTVVGMSLARPFLAAGAREVIGSLWDVSDRSGEEVLVRLHRALGRDGRPSRALRQVQRELIEEDDPALRSPATWGAFTVVGGAAIHSS